MNEVTAQKRPAPIVEFKRNLQRLIDAKELALPSNVSVDSFRNAAIVTIQDNPTILNCNPESLFKAIRRLAAAGLVPDGREAAIVPFKGQAQAMPMVSGLIKTARNSGEVISLWAEVVYEDEEFVMRIERGERIWDHPIDPMTRKGGSIKGAYAVAKLKDGTIELETMGKEQIEKRRRASANQKGDKPTGVWSDWHEEMAKKTVIRALCKRLPVSSDDVRRLMIEDEANEVKLRDVTPQDRPQRKNLAQQLQEAEQQAEQEVLPPDIDDKPTDGYDLNSGEAPTLNGEELDLTDAFPGDAEYEKGVKAFQGGKDWKDCPHTKDREKATHWIGGYMAARDMAEGVE